MKLPWLCLVLVSVLILSPDLAVAEDEGEEVEEPEAPLTAAEVRKELRAGIRAGAIGSVEALLHLRCLSDADLEEQDVPRSVEAAEKIEECAENIQAQVLGMRNEYNKLFRTNALTANGVKTIVRGFIVDYSATEDEEPVDLE